MKTITRYVVVTQVHAAVLEVLDDWNEESGESNLSDIVDSRPVGGHSYLPRVFPTKAEADEFQEEVGRT